MAFQLPALNDELHTCMAGLYLGDTDITFEVIWLHSKLHHCHVLCQSGTQVTHNPEPILLHGIFNIMHDEVTFPFREMVQWLTQEGKAKRS